MSVPARAVVKDDTGLPPEQVATLPIALPTAVHGLKGIGQITAGDKVLIHAGGSGSGSMQIQVAKALRASVATTIRDEAKREFATSIGADLIINTTKEDLVQRTKEWTSGRGVDVVIDNLGGEVLAKSIEAVKPTGTVVALASPPAHRSASMCGASSSPRNSYAGRWRVTSRTCSGVSSTYAQGGSDRSWTACCRCARPQKHIGSSPATRSLATLCCCLGRRSRRLCEQNGRKEEARQAVVRFSIGIVKDVATRSAVAPTPAGGRSDRPLFFLGRLEAQATVVVLRGRFC